MGPRKERGGSGSLSLPTSTPLHLGSPAFLQPHPHSQPPPVCSRTSARSLPCPHQLGTVSPPSSASLGFLACAEGTAVLTGLSGKVGLGKGQLMGWRREAAGSPGAPDFDHQGRCGPRRLHPRALPGGAVPGPSSGEVWGVSEDWRGPVLYGTGSPERGDTLSPLPSPSLASPWRGGGAALSPGVCNSLSPPSILVGSPMLGVRREDPPSHRLGGACGPPGRPDQPASAVGVGGPPRGTKSVGSAEEAWLLPPPIAETFCWGRGGRPSRGAPPLCSPPFPQTQPAPALRVPAERIYTLLRRWGLSSGVGVSVLLSRSSRGAG